MGQWAFGLLALTAIVAISLLVRRSLRNFKAQNIAREVLRRDWMPGNRIEAWTDYGKGEYEKRIGTVKRAPFFGPEGIYLEVEAERSQKAYKKLILVSDGEGGWKKSKTTISTATVPFGN